MSNAFRAAHPNLNILERSLGRISSVSRTILGLFDSWNLLQLALAGRSKGVAEAQDEVEKKTRAYQQALLDFGDSSPKTLEAFKELQAANSKLSEAQESANQGAVQATLQLALMGPVVASQVANLASLAGGWTGLTAAAAAPIAGVGALAIAAGIAGASIFKATSDAISFREAVGKWPTTMEEARVLTKSLADSVPLLGPALAEFTAGLTVSAGRIGEWGEGTQKAFNEAFANISTTLGDWGNGIVTWFGSTLPTALGGAIGSLGSFVVRSFYNFLTDAGLTIGSWGASVVAWFTGLPDRIGAGLGILATVIGNAVRSALNFAVDILNSWIRGLNVLIGGINFAASLVGQPGIAALSEIPHLARGTPFFQGGVAVVGEQGPEIAAFPRGTAVFPSGEGPGGVSVQVNITGFVGSKHELVDFIATELTGRLRSNFQ
ncbi:MAG: hypothetical protein HYU02_07825 [Thaumarchaeota archaeon]|nr:hypothetical protein [Nitrososphaerota archaeon]